MQDVMPSAEIIKKMLVAIVASLLLMMADTWLRLDELTHPFEQGVLRLERTIGETILVVQKPIELIQFWHGGAGRIADLEQRLSDTVVDKARLIELEGEVDTLSGMTGIRIDDGLQKRLVEVVSWQENGLVVDTGSLNAEEGVVTDTQLRLIGRIEGNSLFSSKVDLITRFDHKLTAVVLGKTEIRGILAGNGKATELREVPVEAELAVGDIVVTSGEDGIYPAGLVVGQVVEVEKITSEVSKTAQVDPVFSTEQTLILIESAK